MSNTPRNLTRNQLAEFLPNARAVRAFEQLLEQVSTLLPSDIVTINRLIQEAYIEAASGTSKAQVALDLLGKNAQTAELNAGAADAKATAALDALSSIAKSLELLAKAPPAQADNSTKTDYLDFSLNPHYSMTPGRVHWGSTGTLEIEMGGGNITQQVGEEFFVYGKATAAITEGQLIMVTGAVGASGVVTFAPTITGLLDPNDILGVATENIPLNGFGRVTIMGVVRGIDTTGSSVGEVWADGDVLWYNTAFVGSMTKIKPVAPNMKTQTAIVINAGSGGSGSLQVGVINGSTLGGTDTNVQMGALVDKQLIQYDAAAGYWKNVAVSAVGSTAAETHAATSKATPVDADELPLADSASSFSLKKLTWANLKATLATWVAGNLIPAFFTTLQSSGLATLGSASGGNQLAGRSHLYPGSLTWFSTVADGAERIRFGHYDSSSVAFPTGLVPAQIMAGVTRLDIATRDIAGATMYLRAGTGVPVIATVSATGLAVTAGTLSTLGGATMHTTTTALNNGAGAAVGTLGNAPVAGNPTKWIGINDNGTTRYIPAW